MQSYKTERRCETEMCQRSVKMTNAGREKVSVSNEGREWRRNTMLVTEPNGTDDGAQYAGGGAQMKGA